MSIDYKNYCDIQEYLEHSIDVNLIPGKLYRVLSARECRDIVVKLFNKKTNGLEGVQIRTGDVVMFVDIVEPGHMKFLHDDQVYWWRGSCFNVFEGPLG
jgi:hypothetical protein